LDFVFDRLIHAFEAAFNRAAQAADGRHAHENHEREEDHVLYEALSFLVTDLRHIQFPSVVGCRAAYGKARTGLTHRFKRVSPTIPVGKLNPWFIDSNYAGIDT
jgi:hypothetical protein